MSIHREDLSDSDLVRETRAGSLDAFEGLVRRYEGRVARFLGRICRSETDAHDLCQATFVRAFQALEQFQANREFAAWLFTIARRLAIDHHRAAPPLSEPLPEDLPGSEDPSEQLARIEDGEAFWAAVRRWLPEAQFETLWLRYGEDLPVAEIARIVRKTPILVKVTLFRARQTLAVRLDSSNGGTRPRQAARVTAGPQPSAFADQRL